MIKLINVNISHGREGRKHVFYAPDYPGFRVTDPDLKMAYYRILGELTAYMRKRHGSEVRVTSPGTFNQVFGNGSNTVDWTSTTTEAVA